MATTDNSGFKANAAPGVAARVIKESSKKAGFGEPARLALKRAVG